MSRKIIDKIKCFFDNKLLLRGLIFSTKTVTEKILKGHICTIWEMIAKSEVNSIEWCKSESQLPGCLTKGAIIVRKLLKKCNCLLK